jgi:hypothetical protein
MTPRQDGKPKKKRMMTEAQWLHGTLGAILGYCQLADETGAKDHALVNIAELARNSMRGWPR